jgi:hypothetical protein
MARWQEPDQPYPYLLPLEPLYCNSSSDQRFSRLWANTRILSREIAGFDRALFQGAAAKPWRGFGRVVAAWGGPRIMPACQG